MNKTVGGLAGIVAGETAISTVGKTGVGLTYRGYDIQVLATYATFEEKARWAMPQRSPPGPGASTMSSATASR